MHYKQKLIKKISTGLTPWSSRPLRAGTNGHCLEYGSRSRALPAQPEVEKEKGGRPEAPSYKLQAPSIKRHKRNTFKWQNIKNRKENMKEKEIKEDLDLLKRWELIDMIVDMEKTITKYEDKARHNAKQGKADA